jgi:hypothetical protein
MDDLDLGCIKGPYSSRGQLLKGNKVGTMSEQGQNKVRTMSEQGPNKVRTVSEQGQNKVRT